MEGTIESLWTWYINKGKAINLIQQSTCPQQEITSDICTSNKVNLA